MQGIAIMPMMPICTVIPEEWNIIGSGCILWNIKPRPNREGLCDFEAIEKGMVSVSPIKLDLSAYKSMKKLREWL